MRYPGQSFLRAQLRALLCIGALVLGLAAPAGAQVPPYALTYIHPGGHPIHLQFDTFEQLLPSMAACGALALPMRLVLRTHAGFNQFLQPGRMASLMLRVGLGGLAGLEIQLDPHQFPNDALETWFRRMLFITAWKVGYEQCLTILAILRLIQLLDAGFILGPGPDPGGDGDDDGDGGGGAGAAGGGASGAGGAGGGAGAGPPAAGRREPDGDLDGEPGKRRRVADAVPTGAALPALSLALRATLAQPARPWLDPAHLLEPRLRSSSSPACGAFEAPLPGCAAAASHRSAW